MAGAEVIAPIGDSEASPQNATAGSNSRTGQSPLVVVQQPRGGTPTRTPKNTDTSLRNGYAAISHSISGETAAIGVGFLLGGPVGAVIGGAIAPAALAALMWRSRNNEHDANSNTTNPGGGASGRPNSPSGGSGKNGGNGNGRGRHPNGPSGNGSGDGTHRKPKTKDPILDKLSKGIDNLKRNKGTDTPRGPKNNTGGEKNRKSGGDPKAPKPGSGSSGKGRGRPNDRGPKPDSPKPWRDRDKKKKETPGRRRGDDNTPKAPGDDTPKLPPGGPHDDRIKLVRAKRERDKRRRAELEGKKAADRAAKDGTLGDPHQVKLEVIREANRKIDLELHHENDRLALSAAAENIRSTPVNYPAIQAAPVGTRAAGVAIARQINFRGSTAYAILRDMADQLAHGMYGDANADMGDHIIELVGIPSMCKNLSLAVTEATRALALTAPLHSSVIHHMNNAAIAARSAGMMADHIMVVFVEAHREDIIRILDPRIGEERWNLRNGPGTLDAAKLRAAVTTAHASRLALPAGTSTGGGSKLVPASHASTKRLVNLMKGFDRGHMVVVLSEVAGAAAGVEVVADSITKLYRRMTKTWPTEGIVDETVRMTAGKVAAVSDELKKAIKAAQRAHQRQLRLNAKPRKGARSEAKWDVASRRPSN